MAPVKTMMVIGLEEGNDIHRLLGRDNLPRGVVYVKSKCLDLYFVLLFVLMILNKNILKINILFYAAIALFAVFVILSINRKPFALKQKLYLLSLSILTIDIIYYLYIS